MASSWNKAQSAGKKPLSIDEMRSLGYKAKAKQPVYLDNSPELDQVEQAELEQRRNTPAALKPQSTTQETLRRVEAKSYDTLYGNYEEKETPFKGVSVSNMTIGELTDFSKASGPYGQYVKPRLAKNTYAYKNNLTSTPMGKYQIVGSTLRDLTKRMNLSPDTVFDKKTQDGMFLFLARENVARGSNSTEKRKRLRSIWEGFKHVDNATLDKVISEIEQ